MCMHINIYDHLYIANPQSSVQRPSGAYIQPPLACTPPGPLLSHTEAYGPEEAELQYCQNAAGSRMITISKIHQKCVIKIEQPFADLAGLLVACTERAPMWPCTKRVWARTFDL